MVKYFQYDFTIQLSDLSDTIMYCCFPFHASQNISFRYCKKYVCVIFVSGINHQEKTKFSHRVN